MRVNTITLGIVDAELFTTLGFNVQYIQYGQYAFCGWRLNIPVKLAYAVVLSRES
jgi:hypothetical protein